MDFRLKKSATDYDIPLAYIHMGDIRASDVIQIQDFASYLDGNPSAAFRSIQTYPNTSGRLLSGNHFGKVLVTDEYFYDTILGTKTPLWYIHPLPKVYYNPNTTERTVKKRIRVDKAPADRTITSLIPPTGNYIMVTGSVLVYIREEDSSEYTELTSNDFYVDYSTGTISLSTDAITYDGGFIYDYKVVYKLVPSDIKILSPDQSPKRVEVSQIVPENSNYFTASILSETEDQIFVQYRSRLDTGSIIDTSLYTMVTPLYIRTEDTVRQEIMNDENYDTSSKRVFSQVSTSTYVTVTNSEHLFSYKPEWPSPCLISVKKPYLGDFTSDWNLRITGGKVSNNVGTFEVLNTDNTISLTEIARIIDNKTITVSGTNLIVSLKADGTTGGITVTRKLTGTPISVSSVDVYRGVIRLASSISYKDIIEVSYSIRSNDLILPYPCFNPMPHHSAHNEGAGEVAAIICIIDSRYVPTDRSHPIYIKYVDMLPGGQPITYTYDQLDLLLNSTNVLERQNARDGMDLPLVYYGENLLRLEPLAIVQVVNPFDSDTYEITDMRVFGGGYKERQHSFYDYSNYDGEGTDLESMLVIEVPEWIKDSLKERAKLWDLDVIKSVDTEIDSHANAKAIEIIREKAKKYSMLGTTQEIVIGTKTITNNP